MKRKLLNQLCGLFLLGFFATVMMSPVTTSARGVFMNAIAYPTEQQAIAFPLPIDPTTAVVTSEFGPREKIATTNGRTASGFHKAIDFSCAVGDPITSIEGGTVEYVDSDLDGWGVTIVVISHLTKDEFLYAHLSERVVGNGTLVVPGQAIAKCGDTGNVTGPHLHFEYRPKGGEPVNPRKYLEERGLPKLNA